MPTVTQLKPQRNQKRINVYLDNKFSFGIDLDNLVKFGIKVEREFSKEEIDKIIYEAEFAKIYNKLLNFAALRPRSEQELFNWLKRKEVSKNLHKKLFNRLKRLDLMDDIKFAKWWIEQRLAFKQKSKREMQFELKQKGVSDKIIKEIFTESEIDEKMLAKKQYEKNKYKWRKFEEKVQKQKASAFLARKGFNWDIIKNVVQYGQENDDV